MLLGHVFWFLLFLNQCRSQFSTVQLGVGFIEDSTAGSQQCGILEVQLNISPETPFITETVQERCIEKRRKLKNRVVVTATIDDIIKIGLYVNRLALEFGLHGWQEEHGLSDNLEKSQMFNYLWQKVHQETSFSLKDVKELINQLGQNNKWSSSKAKIFEAKILIKIFEHFNMNPAEVLNSLGFDAHLGYQLLTSMEFSLVCDNKKSPIPRFQLHMCASVNPTRIYGQINSVAPVGNFIQGGRAYRYYDVPHFAITTPNGLISAETCEKKIGYFECQMPKNTSCSIMNYKGCHTVLKMTPQKIFSYELGEATYIATTQPYYRLFSNATVEGTLESVPRSGHFLFQAPRDHFIAFETVNPVQTFYGKHDQLKIRTLLSPEDVANFNHADIDQWNERSKLNNGHLDDNDLAVLHEIYGFHLDYDTIFHYFKWNRLIVAMVGIVAVIIVISTVIVCNYVFEICDTVLFDNRTNFVEKKGNSRQIRSDVNQQQKNVKLFAVEIN